MRKIFNGLCFLSLLAFNLYGGDKAEAPEDRTELEQEATTEIVPQIFVIDSAALWDLKIDLRQWEKIFCTIPAELKYDQYGKRDPGLSEGYVRGSRTACGKVEDKCIQCLIRKNDPVLLPELWVKIVSLILKNQISVWKPKPPKRNPLDPKPLILNNWHFDHQVSPFKEKPSSYWRDVLALKPEYYSKALMDKQEPQPFATDISERLDCVKDHCIAIIIFKNKDNDMEKIWGLVIGHILKSKINDIQ